jgi:myo-inositol-1(or 4)-monophosphatase
VSGDGAVPFAPGVLDDAARAVVERARAVLDGLLDEVRADLAPRAGREPVTMKADGTPVTPADRATDERLVEGLRAAFPTHGALSEEQDHVATGADWTWVLDPIDGTSNFIAGVPYWCVSVALCLAGAPVLGVVEAPALRRRFHAVAGGGAHVTDDGGVRPMAVRAPVPLRDATSAHVPGLYSGGAARDLAGDGVRLNVRVMGASALDLALVADGVAPLSVAIAPHVWDVAAGALLVHEAGGAVAAAPGGPLLPLVPGQDYAERVVPTAAAADTPTVEEALAVVARARADRRR